MCHNIVYRDVCGEAAAGDSGVCGAWTSMRLPVLLSSYAWSDVFNVDETGIFYRTSPDKTMCFKGDSCHNGKQSNERTTAMVCSNMDGTEKLLLLVTGKFG